MIARGCCSAWVADAGVARTINAGCGIINAGCGVVEDEWLARIARCGCWMAPHIPTHAMRTGTSNTRTFGHRMQRKQSAFRSCLRNQTHATASVSQHVAGLWSRACCCAVFLPFRWWLPHLDTPLPEFGADSPSRALTLAVWMLQVVRRARQARRYSIPLRPTAVLGRVRC